jgi:hypothetical protein
LPMKHVRFLCFAFIWEYNHWVGVHESMYISFHASFCQIGVRVISFTYYAHIHILMKEHWRRSPCFSRIISHIVLSIGVFAFSLSSTMHMFSSLWKNSKNHRRLFYMSLRVDSRLSTKSKRVKHMIVYQMLTWSQ